MTLNPQQFNRQKRVVDSDEAHPNAKGFSKTGHPIYDHNEFVNSSFEKVWINTDGDIIQVPEHSVYEPRYAYGSGMVRLHVNQGRSPFLGLEIRDNRPTQEQLTTISGLHTQSQSKKLLLDVLKTNTDYSVDMQSHEHDGTSNSITKFIKKATSHL